MNLFGEAHYPKHSMDLVFDDAPFVSANPLYITGDLDAVLQAIKQKLEDHKEATSITIHVTRTE